MHKLAGITIFFCNILLLLGVYNCPCQISHVSEGKKLICVENIPPELSSSLSSDFMLISSENNAELISKGCSVRIVISGRNISADQSLCPSMCDQLPSVVVPLNILDVSSNTALFCSLTVDQLLNTAGVLKSGRIHWARALHAIANRKIMECSPYKNFPGSQPRSVKAVVIWIGSSDNFALMEDQFLVLKDQNTGDAGDHVVGWAATDSMYHCEPENVTKCIEPGGNKKYGGFLPQSAINFMKPGWRCAQRRPLRALSHVLRLFDPRYIVLLDDDTFFNYPLFQRKFESFVLKELGSRAMFMGEFQGRTGDNGHLSTGGIFAGGSGYILGRRLLVALRSREIRHYGFEFLGAQQFLKIRDQSAPLGDQYRSEQQILHLSVLAEGLEHSGHACAAAQEGAGCVVQPSGAGSTAYVTIGVPLIDFCTNLMASENTCQHSDHSLGRCLLYGADATPVGVACHSSSPHGVPADVHVGMCFTAPSCDVSEQVTCHRYRASRLGHGLEPVRTMAKKGYYRVYSSVYDGNMTDTFM